MSRSNEEIKKDIIDQLFWDSRLNASTITVEVADSRVELTGRVFSYTQKMAAEAVCLMTPGVLGVRNNLDIQCPKERPPEDMDIHRSVSEILRWNPDINAANIHVSLEQGVVTLEGSVPTYWQKETAQEFAYNIEGVLRTVNNLSVVLAAGIIDEAITQAITVSLGRNHHINCDFVNIAVQGGVVTLSGKADSGAAYRDILLTAKKTVGVVNIIDDLRIGQ